MGADVAPALFAVNPVPPYNTTSKYRASTICRKSVFILIDASCSVLANNYFGRQFNSLNDVSVNYRNKHIYFTDVVYGYLQDFRPRPGLPNQVYRLNPDTRAITVVADEFVNCNGEQRSILSVLFSS